MKKIVTFLGWVFADPRPAWRGFKWSNYGESRWRRMSVQMVGGHRRIWSALALLLGLIVVGMTVGMRFTPALPVSVAALVAVYWGIIGVAARLRHAGDQAILLCLRDGIDPFAVLTTVEWRREKTTWPDTPPRLTFAEIDLTPGSRISTEKLGTELRKQKL